MKLLVYYIIWINHYDAFIVSKKLVAMFLSLFNFLIRKIRYSNFQWRRRTVQLLNITQLLNHPITVAFSTYSHITIKVNSFNNVSLQSFPSKKSASEPVLHKSSE